MNIDFILYPTKKDAFWIAVRMRYGQLDISKKTSIFIEKSEDWDKDRQLTTNSSIVNAKLLELKSTILKTYNEDYVEQKLIDKFWLAKIIDSKFSPMRPTTKLPSEVCSGDNRIYLSNFMRYWAVEKSKFYKVSRNKTMNKKSASAYESLSEIIATYEKTLPKKIMLDNITQGDVYQWIDWLESQKYAQSTIDKFVVRMKFILNRAIEEGLNASDVRNQKIYVDNDDEVEGVSLSEEEIQSILDKDLSFDRKLQITKHNFIVGIFTGLRFSDYGKHLNDDILADGFIELRTQKTKTKVVIPLHPELEEVFKLYKGKFPPKQTSNLFNKNLKTICELCEIDETTEGKLFDSEINRKVHGYYLKHKLVTSHTLRRSFVTIHKDVIDEKTLCDILGWSSAQMLKIYDMTTKKDSAKKLKKVWEKKRPLAY